MAQKLDLLYGIDPQKPYSLSFSYLNDFPFTQGNTDMLPAATAQNNVDAIAAGGGVAFGDVNEFVSTLSYAIQGTQGAVVQHYTWTLRDTTASLDPDDLEVVWQANAPNYAVVANAPLQNDIPSAVAGLRLTSLTGNRRRIYAWGLLSQATEDTTFNAQLAANSGLAVADYMYVVKELLQLCAPAIISGRFVEKTFLGCVVQSSLYKGVRRA